MVGNWRDFLVGKRSKSGLPRDFGFCGESRGNSASQSRRLKGARRSVVAGKEKEFIYDKEANDRRS